MKEKDIHDFARQLGVLILSIHKKASTLRLGFLKEDLTFSQFFLLELLYLSKTLKMKEIASEMGTSLPAASALADKMVRMGLVHRERDKNDRRIVNIALQAKGRKIIREVLSRREKMITEIFGKLSQKDRDSYLHILDRIDKILEIPQNEK